MSLNKTLDRLFDEIRREAKRNPAFADRLDAVLQLHETRRDVADEVIESVARDEAETLPPPAGAVSDAKRTTKGSVKPTPHAAEQSAQFNPVGLYKRGGEDALASALKERELPALRALVIEHNLDPSGETEGLDRDALAAHVIAQAKRRAERDDKMFDY